MKVVIGMGNPLKGDDNIGNVVAGKLKGRDGFNSFIGDTTPENLIGVLKRVPPSRIYFLDAVSFSGEPGEVRLFKKEELENKINSTHSMPLSIYEKFFPKAEIFVIGIKPEEIDYGGMTDILKSKIPEIVKSVELIISDN